MKYKAVIFDLFGTVVEPFSSQEYDRSLADMADALSVPRQDFKRFRVPQEDAPLYDDPSDRKEWQGPVVSALKEVLMLVE